MILDPNHHEMEKPVRNRGPHDGGTSHDECERLKTLCCAAPPKDQTVRPR